MTRTGSGMLTRGMTEQQFRFPHQSRIYIQFRSPGRNFPISHLAPWIFWLEIPLSRCKCQQWGDWLTKRSSLCISLQLEKKKIPSFMSMTALLSKAGIRDRLGVKWNRHLLVTWPRLKEWGQTDPVEVFSRARVGETCLLFPEETVAMSWEPPLHSGKDVCLRLCWWLRW